MPHNHKIREQQTIEHCLQTLRALNGFDIEFIPEEMSRGGNGRLRLKGPWGEVVYAVELRLGVTAKTAELVINQIKNLSKDEGRFLLMSDFIYPKVGEAFKQRKVEFIDAVGNAYLNQPPLLIDISGRKKSERPYRAKRAFQVAGLKLVYLLLKQPEAVNWNYRELAMQAGVALGSVSWILRDLREMGYINLAGPNLQKLTQGRHLLNRWEIGYAEILRPQLVLET